MAEHTIRILHLSDLHFGRSDQSGGSGWRDRRILGTAWERNVAALRHDCQKQGRAIDLLVVTGDIAFSAKESEYRAATEFLAALREAFDLRQDRLFVVPGNHDIDREQNQEAFQAVRELLETSGDGGLDALAEEGKQLDHDSARLMTAVRERGEPYRRWLREGLGRPELAPSSPGLGYRRSLRLKQLPFTVQVVGLDTAWLSGMAEDRGRLRVTESQVNRLLLEDGARLPGLRLVLMHHPFEWLADNLDNCRLVGKRADLVLHGHLHEVRPTPWLDERHRAQYVGTGPLFEDSARPGAMQVIDVHTDAGGRMLRCEYWFRSWSPRGFWHDDESLYEGTEDGRLVFPPLPAVVLSETAPAPVFVLREAELQQLERALLGGSNPRPVVVQGMAGVGKSALCHRFRQLHTADFPGGTHAMVLSPEENRSAASLLAELADRLEIPATDPHALPARLQEPRSLVFIDNVDSEPAAALAAEIAAALPMCPLLIMGRYHGLGESVDWDRIVVRPWRSGEGVEQLKAELGSQAARLPESQMRRLAEALAELPLALHLAAGHLRRGLSVEGFLERMQETGLRLGTADPADPARLSRPDQGVLHRAFELSAEAVRESLGDAAGRLWPAFCALGYAPATGFGDSLGAAIAALELHDFSSLRVTARTLGLLEEVADLPTVVHRIHPLLAEWLRGQAAPGTAVEVQERMSEWFLERLPTPPDDAPEAEWEAQQELRTESAALVGWLSTLPDSVLLRTLRAGSEFAQKTGPWSVWIELYERALVASPTARIRSFLLWEVAILRMQEGNLDRGLEAAARKAALDQERGYERGVALARGLQANILEIRGELDEALRIQREECLPVFERLGDARERAVTLGKIADVLQARGELDEALRIRREEELPVYERLGDVHSRAVTLGQIADVLQARGEWDEVLRIRREECLPVYERLGDVHSRAVTLGNIADVLQARGELDEALRIRREECLPVYERLGDVHSRAVTLGKIADVLQARGELDEALRIRREECLPVFERLGDIRERAVTLGEIADVLQARGELDEALRIRREEELPVYERLGDVHSRAVTLGQIADVLQARGELDEALRIRREECLPVYERLGDVYSRAVTLGKIADVLQARGELDEALRIRREEELPVYERLGDVHSRAVTLGQIADVLQARGEWDEVLRIRREECLPVFERLGDIRARAVTLGKIADVLQARGEWDEALRVRREELPAYERLGDLASRMITWMQIARALQRLQKRSEALAVLQKEVLPAASSVSAATATSNAIWAANLALGSGQVALAADLLQSARTIGGAEADTGKAARRLAELENRLLTRSWRLRALRLQNVRNFRSLEWNSPDTGRGGQWIFFIGDNGIGKTTLLRSLCLAFSPDEVAQTLLTTAGAASPIVRLGAETAEVEVEGTWAVPPLSLQSEGGVERLASRRAWLPPFLVAYGARRGSAMGGPQQKVEFGPLHAVETLFSESAGLIHAETWLQGRRLAALEAKKGADVDFFQAVLNTLCRLLPGVDEIHVTADGVRVRGPGVGEVPLAALSDGYITTAGWVIDMVARWSDMARQRGMAVKGDFTQQMTGIALVDDVDLFLHPRWQRDLVVKLRAVFPRMTFVVTTHNPLTLLGSRPGEVYVLRRAPGSADVELVQRDLPPGLDAEAVLTGEWFGLPTTLDHDTVALLEKHQEQLLADPNSPEALDLEEQVKERLHGTYMRTSLERLAGAAAARVLEDEVKPLTAEQRKEAGNLIAQRLQSHRNGAKDNGG